MKRKKKHLGHIFLFSILAVSLSVLVFGNKTWWHLLNMYKDVKILQQEIDKVVTENANLEKEIYQLKTDYNYIEKTAREELGLVIPGEIEYRFIPLRNKKDIKYDN